jgi:LCP family protein required for cell wall assembly
VEPDEEGAPRPARPRRRLLRLAVVLAVLLVVAMVGGVLAYRDLDGNLRSEDAFDEILTERPAEPEHPKDRAPLDILVIGDDSREGQSLIGGETPGLADTTIALHVTGDRSRAYAVSIPRDLIVSRPACRSKADPAEVVPAAGPVMWNAAYSLGGTACLIAQFEQMTRIRVDHFAVVRFDSFIEVVEALDGVPVCVPEAVSSSGVGLPAGTYEANGEQALVYVQNRLDMGDGSDIGRMKRQQAFLAAMGAKATSAGVLANPFKLYRFLSAATGSLITDPELASLTDLAELGTQLRDIGTENVDFLTMPIAPYEPDPNRLAAGPGAQRLWEQLRMDEPLEPRFTAETAGLATGAPGSPGEVVVRRTDYGLCS